LPPSFDAWFARATAVSPADRFASAPAAVLALANALEVPHPGHEHSTSVTIAPATLLAQSPRRTQVALMTATAAFVVAGAIVLPSRTGPVITSSTHTAASIVQQAAGAAAVAEPQSSPGFASVPPAPVPSAVTKVLPAVPVRPSRKTATKAGKHSAIYRR